MVDKNVAIVFDTAAGRLCKTFETGPAQPDDPAELVFIRDLSVCPDAGFFSRWRSAGRFQLVADGEYEGRLAWDTSTGRLCRTVNLSLIEAYANAKSRDDVTRRAKSLDESATEKDPVLAEIYRSAAKEDSTTDGGVSLTRSLAACADIR